MRAYLYRFQFLPYCTLGVLYIKNKKFYTLEQQWENNERAVSCIPDGTYEGKYLAKSASGKYTEVYHLPAVPNRSGILIHEGNLAKDTIGCILLGKKRGKLLGQEAVLNSKTAMKELIKITDKSDIELHIFSETGQATQY